MRKILAKSRARKATMAGVATALLAPAVLMASSPAQAAYGDFSGDPDFTGPTTNEITDDQGGDGNGTMFGAYIPSGGVLDGKRVWCGDPGLDWPYANAFADDASTDINAPDLAYVLWKYDKKRSDNADQMAWDMAIASYLKQSGEIEHRNILNDSGAISAPEDTAKNPGWDTDSKNVKAVGEEKFNDTVVPNAQKHYDEIVKDAKAKSSTVAKAGVEIKGDKVTVTATNADGKAVSGKTAKVSISGATFENGKSSAEFKTGDKAKTYTIKVSEAGKVKANVEVADAKAPTDVVRWRPKDFTDKKSDSPGRDNDEATDGYNRYSVQDMYERKPGTPVKASTEVENKNRPSVVTTINDKDLQAGDEVYDNFTVDGLVGDSKVDVKHELYWSPIPVEQSEKKPDSASKVGEVTSKSVGNGDHKTDTITIPEDFDGGYFYWRESIAETDTTEAWEADHGIPDETGFVPYTPTGSTTVSESSVDKLPAQVSDDGRIKGLMPGQKVTVSLEAFEDADCTVEQSPEIPEDAKSLGVTNLDLVADEKGEVDYTTNKLDLVKDLAKAGECSAVTIVETIAKTDYSEGTTSDYGIPSETVSIDLPKPDQPKTPDKPDKPETPEKPDSPEAPNGPSVHTGAEAENDLTAMWAGLGVLAAAAATGGVIFYRKRRHALGDAESDD